MNRLITAFVLLSLLIFAACAPKQEAPKQEAAQQEAETAQKELVTTSMQDFQDTDNDGLISREEHKANMMRLYDHRDINGDGVQDESEVLARIAYMFKHWDADNDKLITLEEMKTALVGPGWEEIDTTGLECPDNPSYQFMVLDLNKDGFIDKAEYLTFTQKRHAALDTNKDGNVDEKELTEHMMKSHLEKDQDGDKIVTRDEADQYRTNK